MTTLRLILGDQLNTRHSWFQQKNEDVIYLMAEMRSEATYAPHHLQKLIAFFMAMRNFATHLEEQGHRIHYYRISDPENPHALKEVIAKAVKQYQPDKFEYLLPDEYRLDKALKEIGESLNIPARVSDTEHFFTTRNTLSTFFKDSEQLLMERFYRMMRKKHGILTNKDGGPVGGKWNYDQSNRKKWKGNPQIPAIPRFSRDLGEVFHEIQQAGIKGLGNAEPRNFQWPVNRTESLVLLNHFCKHLLPHFGDYQDAMHTEETYLFHSRLSFALNTKMLDPKEVINEVITAYENHPDRIDISQAEGFIRQVLGWREYMRGIYWMEMPHYKTRNYFKNKNPLPDFFWTGNTKMNCLSQCIQNSLDNAYAHHIQRLMVTGNFALLQQTNPDAVDQWYLGIYIDAVEWVEITNTRGMSQFADGGLLATKPYIASANYINKMSNYCKNCKYDHKLRTGEKACPFNALYWNFLHEKKSLLQSNPRMGMMYRLLEKIDKKELQAIKDRSREIIKNPDLF